MENKTSLVLAKIKKACDACEPLEDTDSISTSCTNWKAIFERYKRMEEALKEISKSGCMDCSNVHEAEEALAFDPLADESKPRGLPMDKTVKAMRDYMNHE